MGAGRDLLSLAARAGPPRSVCKKAAQESASLLRALLSRQVAASFHMGLMAPCTLARGRRLGGLPGKENHPPNGWVCHPGRGHQAQRGLREPNCNPSPFLCPHSLWRFVHTPPPLRRTLLGLGRDPRVEERSPHSESERSGLTSCSAWTVRMSLEWASEVIGEDGGWRRLLTAHSHTLTAQQET